MPLYMPEIYEEDTGRTMTATFAGLNRSLRIGDGELSDMENLTSDEYPVLSVRKRRGIPKLYADKPVGLITRAFGSAGEFQPVWIDGTVLHIGESDEINLASFGYRDDGGDRQLVSMGAYIIVIPDMIYINTVKTHDRGIISDVYASGGTWSARVCDFEGKYPRFVRKDTPKAQAATETEPAVELHNGDLWHKTGVSPALYRYDEDTGEWYSVSSYLKVTGTDPSSPNAGWAAITMKSPLQAGDTVRISGPTAVSGVHMIQRVDEYPFLGIKATFFLVEGILDSETQNSSGIRIERVIPKMDFVCEAGNRLWGCRYGEDGQENFVNEIYCSARGDFYRWIAGAADNEDAPVTFSIGTDGAWTGAINHDGYPTFFKERVMHRIGGYGASGFSVYETPCPGVARGAHKSLAVVNNVLYYKSYSAIMAFDGSQPVPVSDKLGKLSGYTGAVGGACGEKYYISLWRTSGGRAHDAHLYVLDTVKGLWFREDSTRCESMAGAGDNMYFIAVSERDGETEHTIMTVEPREGDLTDEVEGGSIPWHAVSGIIGLETPDAKYVTRLSIRLHPEAGSSVRVSVQYDSVDVWKQIGGSEDGRMRTVTLPVTPTRCDHLRLRLDGVGACRVYSITKTIEQSEDHL